MALTSRACVDCSWVAGRPQSMRMFKVFRLLNCLRLPTPYLSSKLYRSKLETLKPKPYLPQTSAGLAGVKVRWLKNKP